MRRGRRWQTEGGDAIRAVNPIDYDEPFFWWGPVWSPPAPRTVLDLIRHGTVPAGAAALLWALLARRASLVVLAGPGGAGKTTLLTALLDFLPPGTRRLYLRGCYESFRFLAEAEPSKTVLLVNEISAHLPVYLWGPGVRRLLGAARDGFVVAATAHATSAEEFVYGLAGYPLRIPAPEIAAVDLLVILDAWEEAGTTRREVREVVLLRPAPGSVAGLTVERLAIRPRRGEAMTVHLDALSAEVDERARALTELADEAPVPADMVQAMLGRLGERWVPPAVIG